MIIVNNFCSFVSLNLHSHYLVPHYIPYGKLCIIIHNICHLLHTYSEPETVLYAFYKLC